MATNTATRVPVVREVIPHVYRPSSVLGIAHSFWNLYFTDQGLYAVKLYDGIWVIIGFLSAIPLAFWPFLITMAIGAKIDEVVGHGRCKNYATRFAEIINQPGKHQVITDPYRATVTVGERETFIMNIFERFKIEAGSEPFYVTRNQIDQVGPIFARYFSQISLKMDEKQVR